MNATVAAAPGKKIQEKSAPFRMRILVGDGKFVRPSIFRRREKHLFWRVFLIKNACAPAAAFYALTDSKTGTQVGTSIIAAILDDNVLRVAVHHHHLL